MRIAFFASSLGLVLSVCAGAQGTESLKLPSGGTLSYQRQESETRFEVRAANGVREALAVTRDATVSPTSSPTNVKIIGEINTTTIILIDTYRSVSRGLSYCQAGEERFLRVLAMAGSQPLETLRIKLESCIGNIELGSPGVEWEPNSLVLKINWLQGPTAKGKPEIRTIRIAENGRVR
jgi:hypothetical protein